jgi:hypothetical protein
VKDGLVQWDASRKNISFMVLSHHRCEFTGKWCYCVPSYVYRVYLFKCNEELFYCDIMQFTRCYSTKQHDVNKN